MQLNPSEWPCEQSYWAEHFCAVNYCPAVARIWVCEFIPKVTCVALYCSPESVNKSQKFGHSSLPWYDWILLTSLFVMISGKTSQFIKRPQKRSFGLGHSFNNSFFLGYFAKKTLCPKPFHTIFFVQVKKYTTSNRIHLREYTKCLDK